MGTSPAMRVSPPFISGLNTTQLSLTLHCLHWIFFFFFSTYLFLCEQGSSVATIFLPQHPSQCPPPLNCPSATFSEVLLSWLPAFLLLSLAVTAGHHGRSTVTAASIATSEFLQRIQMTEGVPDTHFVRTTDLGVHPGPHRVSPSQVI